MSRQFGARMQRHPRAPEPQALELPEHLADQQGASNDSSAIKVYMTR
ncbi:MAG: hypothetical protein U1F68_05365 [Gammaproteobacteria bacterium]